MILQNNVNGSLLLGVCGQSVHGRAHVLHVFLQDSVLLLVVCVALTKLPQLCFSSCITLTKAGTIKTIQIMICQIKYRVLPFTIALSLNKHSCTDFVKILKLKFKLIEVAVD